MAALWIFLLISLLLPHGLIFQGPMANFPVSDCGVSKRCVGSPDSGCLRSGICRELLKYSYDTNADKVRIELFGTPPAPGSTNFWVALGVNQQPGQMAGTLVSECVYNNGAVQAFASFNADSGYSNRRLPPGQEKLGISNDRGAFSNGILSCSFLLDRVRTTNGHDFALDTPLYLVLGDGPADGNTIKPHQTTPWTSEQPLVLTMGQPQTSFPNLQGLQTIAPVRTTAGQAVPLTAGGFIRQSAAASAPPAAITGCAALKGCLAEPAGCLDNGNCNTVASYRLDPNRPGEMVFELWRVMAPAGDQYVAMGLNPTSPSMPGTGVTACVYAQSSVDVLSSYNPFYFSMPIDNPKEGITVMQTGADGSHLYCQFSLQSKKSFRGNFSDSPVEIDLNNPLYFFVAYGQAMPSGGLTKHSVMPSTSTEQVLLAAFPNATTNGTELNSTMTAFDIAPVEQNLTNTAAIPSEGLTRQATPPTAITDCNVLKGCLAEPPGCLNRGNCNSVVSYRVNPASPGELMFELWRVMASSGDQYIAMGVNPTAPKMSDTFVLACVKSSTDFGMLAYINKGHRPIPQLMDDDDIKVHETVLDFPYIYCRFSHKARVINKGTGFQLPVDSLAFLKRENSPLTSDKFCGCHSIQRIIELTGLDRPKLKLD
ncbi:hypothetical protein BV898_17105 [Hypsibius exemplaris]|uniref:DOMON domain-containing protein n=1 Tax=Hypsibius exemplaris TaxID=2072580 RepID=A0A9X6NH43_HYPEX|nr:hypothetical protein BV898_17105 [Hypsibius exemplaris]